VKKALGFIAAPAQLLEALILGLSIGHRLPVIVGEVVAVFYGYVIGL